MRSLFYFMKEGKVMYYCEQCGRPLEAATKYKGMILCPKHKRQLREYGNFLDDSQRTASEPNDYVIDGDVAIFELYDQKNFVNGEFYIDAEDVYKVENYKWRYSDKYSHVVTGQAQNKNYRDLSHVVLDIPLGWFEKNPGMVVDHINGNPTDNRKSNLRLCTVQQNNMNKSSNSANTSGFLGVSYDTKNGTWKSEISKGNKRISFKRYKKKEQAVYARYISERNLYGDYANDGEIERKLDFTKEIPEPIKRKIYRETRDKMKTKDMWDENSFIIDEYE